MKLQLALLITTCLVVGVSISQSRSTAACSANMKLSSYLLMVLMYLSWCFETPKTKSECSFIFFKCYKLCFWYGL